MSDVAPPDHPMYNWSNPKRVGPGVWYMFMLMSCHAETMEQRVWVCSQIHLFCDYFKCGECNGHCHEYIANKPPENSAETKDELFDWVVTFMNAVNKRIGKPTYDRNILFKTFTEQGFNFCDSDCDKKEAHFQSKSEFRKPLVRRPVYSKSYSNTRGYQSRTRMSASVFSSNKL